MKFVNFLQKAVWVHVSLIWSAEIDKPVEIVNDS